MSASECTLSQLYLHLLLGNLTGCSQTHCQRCGDSTWAKSPLLSTTILQRLNPHPWPPPHIESPDTCGTICKLMFKLTHQQTEWEWKCTTNTGSKVCKDVLLSAWVSNFLMHSVNEIALQKRAHSTVNPQSWMCHQTYNGSTPLHTIGFAWLRATKGN